MARASAVFGDTPWAARLPFAAAGLATILLVYAMTVALLRNRSAAIAAAALVTINVQFLLFSRQARNYSFNVMLTCLLIWQFHRLRSWRSSAAFAAIGILLFHAHPIGLASVAGLGVLTIVSPSFAGVRRWFWPAALAIGLYAAPWVILSQSGYEPNLATRRDLGVFLPRLLQFAVECASVTPVVGMVGLYALLRLRRRTVATTSREPRRLSSPSGLWTVEERSLALACAAVAFAQACAVASTHTRDAIWVVGLHHSPAIIALVLIVTGMLLAKLSGPSRSALLALVLLFGGTRLGEIVPWTFWAMPTPSRLANDVVTFHVPTMLRDRVLQTILIQYVKSLARPSPGVITGISRFLKAHASPNDVVITNYGWEALYYHTRLPQGARISDSFPIYEVARAAQLPEYVFGVSDVRWIVCRRAFPAYFLLQDCDLILRELAQAGVPAPLVASIPDTLFENRENVYFRRFADDTYVYPWYPEVPDAQIYRVDWPSRPASG